MKFELNQNYQMGNETVKVTLRSKMAVLLILPDGSKKTVYFKERNGVEYVTVNKVVILAGELKKKKGLPQDVITIKKISPMRNTEEIEGTLDALKITFSPLLEKYARKRVSQNPKDVESLIKNLNKCAEYEQKETRSSFRCEYQLVQSAG